MSRNGAGIYVLPVYGNPVVNGTVIDPVWANGNFSDMATALTTSVSSDGQTPITGNLMMSGFKHTGAGSATAAGQYAVFGQSAAQFTTLGVGAAPSLSGIPLQVSGAGAYMSLSTTTVGFTSLFGYDNTTLRWSLGQNAYGGTDGVSLYVGASQIERFRVDATVAKILGTGAYLQMVSSTTGFQTIEGYDSTTKRWRIGQAGYGGADGFSIYTGVADTERMKINGSGAITMPSQPCVQANRSTSDTYTTNTYTKVAFDAKTIDVASNFATGTFTAPVAGTYQVSFNGYMDSVTTSGELGIRLYKNGTTVGVVFETHLDSTGTAIYAAFSRTGFITLAASDTVEVFMAKINGATVNAYQTTIAIRLMQ